MILPRDPLGQSVLAATLKWGDYTGPVVQAEPMVWAALGWPIQCQYCSDVWLTLYVCSVNHYDGEDELLINMGQCPHCATVYQTWHYRPPTRT
jgi:hypothetical protein